MLVLPSKFDTFGCVVLEALSCGLPVSAYETKGPKDIIEDGKCGFLSNSRKDMAKKIIGYFNNEKLRPEFKKAALVRAADYNSDKIISKLLKDIDFDVMQ